MQEEAGYKLLKVTRQQVGKGGVPYIATHDGRTIRYPDPDIKVRRPPQKHLCCVVFTTRAKDFAFMTLGVGTLEGMEEGYEEFPDSRFPHVKCDTGWFCLLPDTNRLDTWPELGCSKLDLADCHMCNFLHMVPPVQVNDTVMFDIETGKIKDFIKFDVGQLVMVTGGRNVGRVGTIVNRQKHKGSFEIIVVKDSVGHQFATR